MSKKDDGHIHCGHRVLAGHVTVLKCCRCSAEARNTEGFLVGWERAFV